jgi:hypothetical protein
MPPRLTQAQAASASRGMFVNRYLDRGATRRYSRAPSRPPPPPRGKATRYFIPSRFNYSIPFIGLFLPPTFNWFESTPEVAPRLPIQKTVIVVTCELHTHVMSNKNQFSLKKGQRTFFH